MRKPNAPVLAGDVLKEAATLFHVSGYHKTRMRDIAAKFDVTHAALYYHFKSKQDILAQINVASIRDILKTARDISNQDLPVDQCFLTLVRAHFLWVAKNVAYASSLFNFDNQLPPKTLREVRALRREYTEILTTAYGVGVKERKFLDVDPRMAIGFIIGAGNWVYHWYKPGDPREPETIVDVGMALVAKGFLRRDDSC